MPQDALVADLAIECAARAARHAGRGDVGRLAWHQFCSPDFGNLAFAAIALGCKTL